MSSIQDPNSPLTLAEELEERIENRQVHQDQIKQHQERSVEQESRSQPTPQQDPEPLPEHEPQSEYIPQPEQEPRQDAEQITASSHLQNIEQLPQTPPENRDPEGRVSAGPTCRTGFPRVDPFLPQVLHPPRISQIVDRDTAGRLNLTAAAQLIMNPPDDHQTISTMEIRSPADQPIATWIGGNGHNSDADIAGSTSSISNRNPGTERRHSVSTTTTSAGLETMRHAPIPAPGTPPCSNRSQVQLPALRPAPSTERRVSASGLGPHNPMKGDGTFQPLCLPHWNGYDGRGDLVGGLDRNTSGRAGVPGPRSATGPTDLTMVENGPGTWVDSRGTSGLMAGEDLFVGVPVVEESRVSACFLLSICP